MWILAENNRKYWTKPVNLTQSFNLVLSSSISWCVQWMIGWNIIGQALEQINNYYAIETDKPESMFTRVLF